jgi:hypothetical protein
LLLLCGMLILCLAALGSTQVWVKPNTEQSFLYGNHVAKAGLGRMTENTPKYQGVVVYNMNDVPLVSAPQSNPPDPDLSHPSCNPLAHACACASAFFLLLHLLQLS